MKPLLLALAFLPIVVVANPIKFTVNVNPRDDALRPIAGDATFTFDDTKERIVTWDNQYGSRIAYIDQKPIFSQLAMPDETRYTIGASTRMGDDLYATSYAWAEGIRVSMDENGYWTNDYISIISSDFHSIGLSSLSPDEIVRYFSNSENLIFSAYSIKYTDFPQPASDFTSKYYYRYENAKLVSVSKQTQVPEPATFASLILGLGIIGFARKRRTKPQSR